MALECLVVAKEIVANKKNQLHVQLPRFEACQQCTHMMFGTEVDDCGKRLYVQQVCGYAAETALVCLLVA